MLSTIRRVRGYGVSTTGSKDSVGETDIGLAAGVSREVGRVLDMEFYSLFRGQDGFDKFVRVYFKNVGEFADISA